jgi:hypothetical protein
MHSQIGIGHWVSVPSWDRPNFRSHCDFYVSRTLIWLSAPRRTANHFRLQGLAVLWPASLRVAAMISGLAIMRRNGTTRAFVVSGYENIRHERGMVRNAAMERTAERFAIF